MKKLLRCLTLSLLGAAPAARAQTTTGSVGIGTATPDASALLELSATTKGLLLPRMILGQRVAIQNPAEGLLVYQYQAGPNPAGLYYYRPGPGWTYLNPAGADNLGSHTATQALTMSGNPINFGTTLGQQLNLWSTDYGLGIQPGTLLMRSGNCFAWYKGGSYSATQYDPGSGGTMQMVLNEFGRLGLGTSTPLARLDLGTGGMVLGSGLGSNATRPAISSTRLAGEIGAVGRADNGADVLADNGFLRLSAGGGYSSSTKTFLDLSGDSQQGDMRQNIVLGTGGTERVRLTSTGSLGIGTPAPSATLHVVGSARVEGLAGTGTRVVTADADGNLATTGGSLLARLAGAQSGTTDVGAAYGTTGVRTITVTFPTAFAAPPAQVLVTVRGQYSTDTFAVTTVSVTATDFQVNVLRADGGYTGSGYNQNPRLDWLAIP